MRRHKGLSIGLVTLILTTALQTGLAFPEMISSIESRRYNKGSFEGGTGTESDPYLITDVHQLQNMSKDLSAHYQLINDIDASITRNWNDGSGFDPIGNESVIFGGGLDGQGFIIDRIFVNRTDSYGVGLFYGIDNGVLIENISLENISIKGYGIIGGIAGFNHDGIIDRCYTDGYIEGQFEIGGIVGRSDYNGKIKFCRSAVELIGDNAMGGVVGWNKGYIESSYTEGRIESNSVCGGVVGCHRYGQITNSYSTMHVNGSTCGGLVGYVFSGSVVKSYSTGRVSGASKTGGLIGDRYYGGNIFNCVWDINTSGQKRSQGGFGKYTAQMKDIDTFKDQEWDLSNDWNIIPGNSYPFLRCFDYGVPEIITEDTKTVYEDERYLVRYRTISSLPRGEGARWSLKTNGSWLNLSTTGILHGNPTNYDVGSYWVNISATIYFECYDHSNFTLNVINVNDDPVINTVYLPNAIEDIPYRFEIDVTDIDPSNDDLEWSLKTDSSFLHLDSEKGVLNGCPGNGDVGTWWANIKVHDRRGGSDEANFTLRVINVNDDPEILPFELEPIVEDQSFTIDLDERDIDPTNDKLTWKVKTDAPFINFNSYTGIILGKPTNDHVGKWYITVNLTDDKGGWDEVVIELDVQNSNDDPEILEFDIPEILEDNSFFIDMEAVDIDPTDDLLEWNLRTEASFIDVNTNTGNMTGTPTNDDVGDWWVNVSVSDGNGGLDWKNFTLTVLNVNDCPELNVTGLTLTMDEDSDGTYFIISDVFIDVDGDVLTYDHEESRNLSISIEEGIVTVIPDPDWCGTEMVDFTARDEIESASINVIIDVRPINDAPIDAMIIAESSYVVGSDQIVTASATDADIPYGDELLYRWSSNISGEIGGGPSINLSLPIGHHLITLTVTDKEGLSATATMEIEIKPVEEEKVDKGDDTPIALIMIIAIILVVLTLALVIFFLIRKRKTDMGPIYE